MSDYVWRPTISPYCPYNLKRCEKECREVLEAHGCSLDVPVKYRNRHSGDIAFVSSDEDENGKAFPTGIAFCSEFFRLADEKACRDVLLHELAHYIAIARSGKTHGHDAYFKSICKELGTSYDTAHSRETLDIDFEWMISCDLCEKVVAYGCGDPSIPFKVKTISKDGRSKLKEIKLLGNSKCPLCGGSLCFEPISDHRIIRKIYGMPPWKVKALDQNSEEVQKKLEIAASAGNPGAIEIQKKRVEQNDYSS